MGHALGRQYVPGGIATLRWHEERSEILREEVPSEIATFRWHGEVSDRPGGRSEIFTGEVFGGMPLSDAAPIWPL